MFPRDAPSNLEIGGITFCGMKTSLAAHNHLSFILLDERSNDRVRDIGRIAVSVRDQTPFVQLTC